LKLIASSSKVVFVPDSEVAKLLSSQKLKKSPEIQRNGSQKKISQFQKSGKPLANKSSYYTKLLDTFEKNPGYGFLNSRFAFNRNTHSDQKMKNRVQEEMKAHKNIDKPTSYAYYLKDTVTPSYDEIQTGRQQSQRESQRPSRRNSKKRKNESAKKNNTRIESKD